MSVTREPEANGHVERAARPRIRVILADDSDDVRLVLSTRLRRDGRFEVVGEASDGPSAVDLAAAVQPDLVLLDLAMPAKDGLEVLPRLRRRAPGAKIVVLSGFQGDRVAAQALALGAEAYVTKGGSASELIDIILPLFESDGAATPLTADEPARGRAGLAAFIHDDLDAFVRTINDAASALLDHPRDVAEQLEPQQLAATVARAASALRTRLERVADADAILSGALELRLRPTDVAEVVRQVLADRRIALEPRVMTAITSGRCIAPADPFWLSQAVEELVANVAAHTPPSTTVEITVTARDDVVALVVLDRGAGVGTDVEPFLFERFVRRSGSAGTGLGLAIARGIAAAHGGAVDYDRPTGGGARFTLELPVAEPR